MADAGGSTACGYDIRDRLKTGAAPEGTPSVPRAKSKRRLGLRDFRSHKKGAARAAPLLRSLAALGISAADSRSALRASLTPA